ncbi:MAG TPA: hypothetical protein VN397_01275 [Candidatus Methylomirabilis sp.]|nr:hypothetical protein [Candidatus Methylomirabilis sp.]
MPRASSTKHERNAGCATCDHSRHLHPASTLTFALGLLTAVVVAPVLVFAAMNPNTTRTSEVAPGVGAITYQATGIASAASILAVTTEEEVGEGAEDTFENGIPECLTDCRSKMVACSRDTILKAQESGENIGTGAATGLVVAVDLSTCQSRYDRCSRDCRPVPPPAVDCDTRCAVRVGACIRAAGDDEIQFNQCRADNLACLVTCGRGRGKLESVPPALCQTQCRREISICLASNAYDEEGKDECRQIGKLCVEKLCSEVTLSALGIKPLQWTKASCTTSCREGFRACLKLAGGEQESVLACRTQATSCANGCKTFPIKIFQIQPLTSATGTQAQ